MEKQTTAENLQFIVDEFARFEKSGDMAFTEVAEALKCRGIDYLYDTWHAGDWRLFVAAYDYFADKCGDAEIGLIAAYQALEHVCYEWFDGATSFETLGYALVNMRIASDGFADDAIFAEIEPYIDFKRLGRVYLLHMAGEESYYDRSLRDVQGILVEFMDFESYAEDLVNDVCNDKYKFTPLGFFGIL